MNQPGVRLPAVFVLEFSPANRTLESGILAALDAQMLLQRISPHVLLAALETPPELLQVDCKEKSRNYYAVR